MPLTYHSVTSDYHFTYNVRILQQYISISPFICFNIVVICFTSRNFANSKIYYCHCSFKSLLSFNEKFKMGKLSLLFTISGYLHYFVSKFSSDKIFLCLKHFLSYYLCSDLLAIYFLNFCLSENPQYALIFEGYFHGYRILG